MTCARRKTKSAAAIENRVLPENGLTAVAFRKSFTTAAVGPIDDGKCRGMKKNKCEFIA